MVIDWSEAETNGPRGDDPRIPAAEYVRMSTEHQRYSTDNQRTAIRSYAERRGYEIVRTYADEGKSGLNLGGRLALQELLQDVEAGQAHFRAVLVYDVSRWGRFQDPDEAATYELRCRRAGVDVHYCAEQFENDGSIGSSIIKTVKRAMAGEYRRRQRRGLTEDQIAVMQRESENLDRELRAVEERYSSDNLDLVLAVGYVSRLLGNAQVVRYLAQHYGDILSEFQKIADLQKAA